jgi:hypothetical protein
VISLFAFPPNILLACAIGILLSGCGSRIDSAVRIAPGNDSSSSVTKREIVFGGYTVETETDTESGSSYVRILQNGREKFRLEGFRFYLGSRQSPEDSGLGLLLEDVTGNGQPNLVVKEWSGGAHCCASFHVFELGEKFRHVQTIVAADNVEVWFENLDEDPALEIELRETCFAYWRTSFAGSPMPRVVLKYQEDTYKLAPDLMRQPPPTASQIIELVAQTAEAADWRSDGRPPVVLWEIMLDLLYSGNESAAWKFFDLAWPSEVGGKDAFRRDFLMQLSTSRYWQDLRAR